VQTIGSQLALACALGAMSLLRAMPLAAQPAPPGPLCDITRGCEAWAATYDGPTHGNDHAGLVRASPDGAHVYVVGGEMGAGGIRTLSYDAIIGERSWLAAHVDPAGRMVVPNAMVVSPGGERLYLAGTAFVLGSGAVAGFYFVKVASGGVSRQEKLLVLR
jgi:hypothetical protein